MAQQPQGPEHIPQPLQHDADELVMNVYPLPGSDIAPDYPSQDEMGEYLMDRFEPEEAARLRVVYEATGRTMPSIQRVPVGHRDVKRWRATDEWVVTPRVAAAVMIGSAILFNGVGNHETIEGAAARVGHDIYRVFSPVHDTIKKVPHVEHTPGKIVDLHVEAGVASTDVSGAQITLNRQEISSLHQKVQVLKSKGGKVLSMTVIGETSDDWSTKGDGAFGQPDKENRQLGVQVARSAYKDVQSDLMTDGLTGVRTKFGQHETVLPKDVVKSMTVEAKSDGYGTLESAVQAVDHGELRKGHLFQRIRKFVTSNRGESIDVKVAVPGKVIDKVTTTKEKIPGVDHVPHIPKPGFFWFIPMIPFRRRERYVTQKQVKQWQFTPSKEIMKPRFFREEVDQAWVRIRPEAVQEDGTLVQNSWAFTRKYEHLLRDGRITDVLRADFDSPEGEDKQLRIMFVDHAPAKETVAMFTELLEKFAAMDGGKIADRVSGIFVYPSENAGTEHDEPKRIAMGVDKQSESNVLGTYTYILDLVELHMPTDVDPKELEELLSSFDGPAWTLAHEVAGHGTDDSDEPLRLRRIAGHPIPNAHVIEGDPRAQKMKPLEKVLSRLPRHGKKREKDAPPIEFDIEYQVPDKNGQLVTMQARVEEGDPRLSHASHATIVGYIPTQYGGTNNPEHYAETAAATTTGIAVPYHEATVSVPLLKTDEGEQAVFADGYRPDARGQQVFTKSVGAEQGIFPVSFKADPSREEPPVTISHMRPEYDALLRQEMIRTRGLRTLTPAQMVAILARVTQRNSKKA